MVGNSLSAAAAVRAKRTSDKRIICGPNVERARAELKKLIGPKIRIEADHEEIRFLSEEGRVEAALVNAVSGCQICVVAGACFGAYLEVRLG